MGLEKRWVNRLAAGAFLLCAAALVWLLWLETVPPREPVYLTPEANGGALELDGLYLYAGPLSLSFTLPDWEEPQRPMLEIRGLYTAAELRLDGAPFQTFPPGLGFLYTTLPMDLAGRTLTLSMEKREADPIPTLYLTSALTSSEQTAADACRRAFPTAVFGVIFLLTLGLFLYGWTKDARPWPMLLLSAAALGQTLHFYLQNFPSFSLSPALYGLALYQSRSLLFAAPPLYLLLAMKKRRKAFAPFAILPALIYFAVAGFQTVIPLFSGATPYVGIVYYPAVAALLVCSVLEYRDGNPSYRLLVPCLGACAAGGALLCAVSALRTGTLPFALQILLTDPGALYLDVKLYCWSSLLLALCILESAASQIQRMAGQDAEIQVLSARESLIREQLATVQESAAALRELRHEVTNHYLVLQSLCRAGKGDQLDAYLSELVSEVTAIPPLSYAPHPAINAVLTAMLARARKQGIEAEHRVDVPETLPFADTELCTVLMNLLQNALDANARAPEGARKWLRVDLHVRGLHLYIGVENSRFTPVDYDEETGLCRTTKADKAAHGYGLRAVQKVAWKYKSELLLKFPDGLFSAATALQLPE